MNFGSRSRIYSTTLMRWRRTNVWSSSKALAEGTCSCKREVETLLDHFDAATSFLETSPFSQRIGFLAAQPQALTAGSVVGSFEIVHLIGRGGMGEVYRATDNRLKRDVALKVLPTYLTTDARALCRFELEAQAAGRLNHSNIVAVYDIGVQEGAPYLVSELLEGESLRSRLAKGRLTLRTAIDYARQIAGGLAAAHRVGITHRDIKPENLFITQDGRVKILDFGLATCVEARPDKLAERVSTPSIETEPNRLLGTPPYMSPEQIRGERRIIVPTFSVSVASSTKWLRDSRHFRGTHRSPLHLPFSTRSRNQSAG